VNRRQSGAHPKKEKAMRRYRHRLALGGLAAAALALAGCGTTETRVYEETGAAEEVVESRIVTPGAPDASADTPAADAPADKNGETAEDPETTETTTVTTSEETVESGIVVE
jgi:hypothetical protein